MKQVESVRSVLHSNSSRAIRDGAIGPNLRAEPSVMKLEAAGHLLVDDLMACDRLCLVGSCLNVVENRSSP
jgi:hypothetical protein